MLHNLQNVLVQIANKMGLQEKLQFRRNVFLRGVLRLLATANVPNSPMLVTLMMEAILSSETSFLTRADGIPHSHRRENLSWAL
jgi:hypothetical protein